MQLLGKKKLRKASHVGIALGGGAVLGAAHIGVLRAIEEADIKIDFISGTSIGAVVAALYAFGKSWQEISDIALDIRWLEISSMNISKYGLLSNNKIGHLIEKHLGDACVEDGNIPLAVVATDISNGTKKILTEGRLAEAVRASACIPGIYTPVEYNNTLLVDGGIIENVPVISLKELGAKFTIGVDLNAKHQFKKPENIFELLVSTVNLAMANAEKLQSQKADLTIAPDLSEFNIYDTSQIKQLINKGYKDAAQCIKNAT